MTSTQTEPEKSKFGRSQLSVEQLLAGHTPPAIYGSYTVYDGAELIGIGYSADLMQTYANFSERLAESAAPVFIWKPDLDGSIQEWLERAEPVMCPHCGGGL